MRAYSITVAELWALKDGLHELLALGIESKNLGESKLLSLRPRLLGQLLGF